MDKSGCGWWKSLFEEFRCLLSLIIDHNNTARFYPTMKWTELPEYLTLCGGSIDTDGTMIIDGLKKRSVNIDRIRSERSKGKWIVFDKKGDYLISARKFKRHTHIRNPCASWTSADTSSLSLHKFAHSCSHLICGHQ
jgi:hypothetical protein